MGWRLGDRLAADRHYFRGIRLLREGAPARAVKDFDQVIAVLPQHARAHIQRAKALAAAGRSGEAVGAARRAAELAPRSHAPMVALGQIQYDAGHLEEARKAFLTAARLDPDNRLVKAYLGLVLLALQQVEEGTRLVDDHLLYGYEEFEARLLTLAEQYLWEHRGKARSLEEQLTPDEGAREEGPAGFGLQFASALRRILLGPIARLRGGAAPSRLLAEEAFSVRDWDRAIVALQEAEKAGAATEETAAGLGLAYLEARNPQAAAEQFLRLSDETRSEPDIALPLGAALFDCDRHEEAREPLRIATLQFTRDFVPAYLCGLCEVALGQPGAATHWFLLAVARLNPQLARKRFEEMMRVRQGAPRD